MLGLKLNHVSKRVHEFKRVFSFVKNYCLYKFIKNELISGYSLDCGYYQSGWYRPIFEVTVDIILEIPDSFTVPLHNSKGRQMPVQSTCRCGLKNGEKSHWSREPIMQWGTKQSQSIFRPNNHKSMMPANLRPCLLSHQQSYCHQATTVQQSKEIQLEDVGGLTSRNAISIKVACFRVLDDSFNSICCEGTILGMDFLFEGIPFTNRDWLHQ